jgi:hypothetical protein
MKHGEAYRFMVKRASSKERKMDIILDQHDLDRLSHQTLAELLKLSAGKAVASLPLSVAETGTADYDYKGLVDLDLEQLTDVIKGLSKSMTDGLRVFAEYEHVVDAHDLIQAWGNDNLAALKAATTKRARTITGARGVMLMNHKPTKWDEDGNEVAWDYFVTPKTWQSLRAYFGLEKDG